MTTQNDLRNLAHQEGLHLTKNYTAAGAARFAKRAFKRFGVKESRALEIYAESVDLSDGEAVEAIEEKFADRLAGALRPERREKFLELRGAKPKKKSKKVAKKKAAKKKSKAKSKAKAKGKKKAAKKKGRF